VADGLLSASSESRGGVVVDDVARAYEELIERFVAWACGEEGIRAAVVIGSRARTDHPADEWAGLDILIWSTDPAPYLASRDSTAAMGEAWIPFEDTRADRRVRELRVLFAGGLDVDFAFVKPGATRPDENLADIARVIFRRGARVLLDRDGEIAGMLSAVPPPPASGAARDVGAPDAAALDQVASDFWYHAVWTAKHLRRGELWWAKGGCDGRLKELLQVALEWDAAAHGRDHWFRGRYLEEWADPAVVRDLGRAFARYDEDEIWAALGVTMDLFSRVARQLAETQALPYPALSEQRARELVHRYEATRGDRR
jgi:aminoglycoside 6-adenylyltransferase